MQTYPLISWIIAALVAVAALSVLFRMPSTTPLVLDLAMILSTILVIILLFDSPTVSVAVKDDSSCCEDFTASQTYAPPLAEEDGSWVQGMSTTGTLVTYVSAFQSDSYPGDKASNVWESIADEMMGTALMPDDDVYSEHVAQAAAASSAGITCQPTGPTTSMDFTFNTNKPLWKSGTGFALTNTILTGPMTMDVFPLTRDYTVFCLFQLTGLPTNNSSATLFSIPANGTPQNGAKFVLSAFGTPTGSSIKAHVKLQLGSASPLPCSDSGAQDTSVTFDTSARYLLTITRSSTSVRVSLFHAESSSAQCVANVILSTTTADVPLVYNNQNIVINGDANDTGNGLQGYIMTFGIFDTALAPQDEALICSHYHDMLLLQDPLVQAAKAAAAAAAAALACPYDKTTCDACSSVVSWTNSFQVANGGAACLSAIDAYCTANPTATGCECYNPAKVLTNSMRTTCQAIRSTYSGNSSVVCAGPIRQALTAAENTRKAAEDALILSERQLQLDAQRQREIDSCLNDDHTLGDYDEIRKCHVCTTCGQCIHKTITVGQSKPSFFAWLFGL